MADLQIHNFDFNKLMEFASTAKGDVYLKTPDGDVLNLKSRLTQLLALSSAIEMCIRDRTKHHAEHRRVGQTRNE